VKQALNSPLYRVETRDVIAKVFRLSDGATDLSDLIVPVLAMAVPVLGVVVIALVSGRRLSGSCGGVGPDGRCSRCGKPAAEIPEPGSNRGPCD
jgi:hypothetical protein